MTTLAQTAGASEDAPHRPFAYWADIPPKGELIAGFVYMEWREWRNPGTLSRGAMMIRGDGRAGAGEAGSYESVSTEEEACEVLERE